MTDKIIQTLKLKLVAAELAKLGITDRAMVVAIAERTMVGDNGELIGLKADGNRGVGSAANYELSIADVAQDMGETVTAAQPPGQGKGQSLDRNPFVKGPHWNLTEQVMMMKSDPERAEYMQHLASIGRA
ncbi:hypothetical protein ACQKQD_17965 [Methylobacterium sp. NPDC080182]|uniref:hypothetical protein n=1 Tax=Methylobacterium sp. NPDC080182 TaxID=3390590 RepID=UPI003CFEAB47